MWDNIHQLLYAVYFAAVAEDAKQNQVVLRSRLKQRIPSEVKMQVLDKTFLAKKIGFKYLNKTLDYLK